MYKKLYIAPMLLSGPLNPGDDEEEEMNYSSQGSGSGPEDGEDGENAMDDN